jgi:hypothetical protein
VSQVTWTGKWRLWKSQVGKYRPKRGALLKARSSQGGYRGHRPWVGIAHWPRERHHPVIPHKESSWAAQQSRAADTRRCPADATGPFVMWYEVVHDCMLVNAVGMLRMTMWTSSMLIELMVQESG